MNNGDRRVIEELAAALDHSRGSFVSVELEASHDQESGDLTVLSNVSFPAAEIRQIPSRATSNPSGQEAGYVALRLKNATVQYDAIKAKFERSLLDPDLLTAISLELKSAGSTDDERATIRDGILSGHAKLDGSAPFHHFTGISVTGGLGLQARGDMRSHSSKGNKDVRLITSRIAVSGQKYSRSGGQALSFSGAGGRFEIEIAPRPGEDTLHDFVFHSAVAIKSVRPEPGAVRPAVTARWHVRGNDGFKIESAAGLFGFLAPPRKARRELMERALSRMNECLRDNSRNSSVVYFDEVVNGAG